MTDKKESVTRNIRLPKELFEKIKKLAEQDRRSINEIVVFACEDKVKGKK